MEKERFLNRFLSYVKIDSRSDNDKGAELEKGEGPSTPGQIEVIEAILSELEPYYVPGMMDANILSDGSLLLYFPGKRLGATMCLAAHVDTYYAIPGGANPIIHHYKGGNIELPKNGKVISADSLAGKEGKTIITTDGSTTLGGDDKAGVAILVQVARDILTSQITDYPPLYMWFCTDEEVSRLDIEVVPPEVVKSWDILITVDGGDPRDIGVECFSITDTIVEFFGQDAHAGDRGYKIKSANYAMCRLVIELETRHKVPWDSHGRDGMVYAAEFDKMRTEHAKVYFCPRSFDLKELAAFNQSIKDTAQKIARYYGVDCKITDDSKLCCINIKEAIDAKRHLVEPISKALAEVGYKDAKPFVARYGTDGSMINVTHPNLPTPDIGTGAYDMHSELEFVVLEEMYDMYRAVRALLPLYVYPKNSSE